ncbi:MAG: AarF/UbiB family protein [Planctomycetota bacterium]
MKQIRALKQAAAVVPIAFGGKRNRSRRILAERLAPLRGASTKIAQLMTARDGEDAGEALEALPLSKLQPTLQRVIPDLIADGCDIAPQGRRASLAQVHRARLGGGRDVALKVLLPGVEDDLLSDLSVVGWVGRRAAQKLNQRFDGVEVSDWVSALGDELIGELDYEAEGRIQARYRDAAREVPGVVVPEPVLARAEVLVSVWEEGSSLAEAMAWDDEAARARAGEALSRGILVPMLEHGLVHGDLHPGNVAFRAASESCGESAVVLYDFGATREIDEPAREAWKALIQGDRPAWDALMELGFDGDRLEPLRDRLDGFTALVFGPFREEGPVRIDSAARKASVERLLGEQRMVPRLASPTSAIPVIRTLSGLLSILGHLKASMELAPITLGSSCRAS